MILKGNQAVVAGQLGVSANTLLVLLDSGATGNFINQDYVSSQQLETTDNLSLFDGSPTSLGPIEEYVDEEILVAGVKGRAKFGDTHLSGVLLVLGYPWL